MDAFIGTILPWPMIWAPDSWNNCNGTIIQVAQYQALYSLIGNTFGGSGTQTMGLPDLRGRTLVGYNPNQSALPYNTVGFVAGSVATTLTPNNLPAHVHGATFSPTQGPATITIAGSSGSGLTVGASINVATSTPTVALAGNVPAAGANYLGGAAGTNFKGPYTQTQPAAGSYLPVSTTVSGSPSVPSSTVTISTVTGGSVTVAAGGGVATPVGFTNMQPYMAVNFIISLMGLYPMRP